MSEGQRKARNCQRWLTVFMAACLWSMWDKPDTRIADRGFVALMVCFAAIAVIDAMRALAEDRA